MTTETAPMGELAVRAEPLLPMDTDSAERAMTAYQELTRRLLTAEDWQGPPGRKGSFVKRRGWAKVATFYGVSTEILREHIDRDEHGKPTRARVVARAVAANGRHADGDGACSIDERRFSSDTARKQIAEGRVNVEHDLPATAATRAVNRAISNLIGFGEVSAEEISETSAPETAVLPGWAQPVPDVGTIAAKLVAILQASGVDRPGEHVNRIGQHLMDVCDGTIPVCVQAALEDIADTLPAAPAPDNSQPDPES